MFLEINNLSVQPVGGQPTEFIVRKISMNVERKRIVGLVGGSGSGKTTTGLAVMRLLADQLYVAGGEIRFDGRDLLELPDDEMRQVRGKEIGMVFQEPLHAFNPVYRIGFQIDEVLKYHTDLDPRRRKERILELLETVGIDDPIRVCGDFPHQLSGGMRQRAMIAQAIAGGPKLLIADEPTSNLDVTLQARIIELFRRLREELDLTILLITHDLGVVRHLSDQVIVMNGGAIVETGATQTVLENPNHEYTRRLVEAVKI